jgi:hypothetical protein
MKRSALKTVFLTLLLMLLPLGVSAQEALRARGPVYQRGGLAGTGLVVGAKVGAGLSQPFGDLGTSFITELELGYVLPVLDHSFQLLLSGAYTQPHAEGTVDDARLAGKASYSVTQQQAMVTLGVLYRVPLANDLVRPYAAVGPRLFAMRSKVKGSVGEQAFGENEETTTQFGVWGALGTEFHFGPGALLLEVSLAWAKIDGYVLRDTSAGALGGSIGYRLFL